MVRNPYLTKEDQRLLFNLEIKSKRAWSIGRVWLTQEEIEDKPDGQFHSSINKLFELGYVWSKIDIDHRRKWKLTGNGRDLASHILWIFESEGRNDKDAESIGPLL